MNVANPSRETTPLLRPPHSDLGGGLKRGVPLYRETGFQWKYDIFFFLFFDKPTHLHYAFSSEWRFGTPVVSNSRIHHNDLNQPILEFSKRLGCIFIELYTETWNSTSVAYSHFRLGQDDIWLPWRWWSLILFFRNRSAVWADLHNGWCDWLLCEPHWLHMFLHKERH